MSHIHGELLLALQRFGATLNTASGNVASTAIGQAVTTLTEDVSALVEAHNLQRQFVHGVGPLYVAKTRNPGQLVEWNEIVGKPTGVGTIDPSTLSLDGSQITTGTVNVNRLPVAAYGETSAGKLLRSDDPRLVSAPVTATTGDILAAGDFVAVIDDGGTAKVVPARSSIHPYGAIGYVAESKGIGEIVEVFPYGENVYAPLWGATVADLGKTVFLSDTAGKASLTPPTSGLLQPIGSITRLVSGGVVGIMTRYEFRFQL